jgi:hypothetical protein
MANKTVVSNINVLQKLDQTLGSLDVLKQELLLIRENLTCNPTEVINTKSTKVSFTPKALTDLYNEYARKNNWATVIKLTDKRAKKAKDLIKNVPEKHQWESIFNYISQDSFWNSIMDFDKIYRNDNYINFLEKSAAMTYENNEVANLFVGEGHYVG